MPRLHVRSARELAVELDGGQRFTLHPIWLRERCRDARSMDLRTGQRLHDPSDLDPDLSITSVSEPESGLYRIRFSDGHEADLVDVRSTAEASDLAYTSLPLDPHTDNPYRDPVPGVQLLHCLVNETAGGLSTLVDGFAAARALADRDPDAFALLSRTPVRFRYQDQATE